MPEDKGTPKKDELEELAELMDMEVPPEYKKFSTTLPTVEPEEAIDERSDFQESYDREYTPQYETMGKHHRIDPVAKKKAQGEREAILQQMAAGYARGKQEQAEKAEREKPEPEQTFNEFVAGVTSYIRGYEKANGVVIDAIKIKRSTSTMMGDPAQSGAVIPEIIIHV